MEGVQGWMAEIERRQGRTTYFGAAAILIAVAAAAGALFLAITTPNSASKDDFDDLEAEVKTLQEQVSRATTDQARLKELNLTIQALEARVAAGEQKANQTVSRYRKAADPDRAGRGHADSHAGPGPGAYDHRARLDEEALSSAGSRLFVAKRTNLTPGTGPPSRSSDSCSSVTVRGWPGTNHG